jgi:protein TonB
VLDPQHYREKAIHQNFIAYAAKDTSSNCIKMEAKQILQADFLDLLFENRNKAYGAYELRWHYKQRAEKALLTMLLFVAIVCTIPILYKLSSRNISMTPPTFSNTHTFKNIEIPTQIILPVTPPISPSDPIISNTIPVDIVAATQVITPSLPTENNFIHSPVGNGTATTQTNSTEPFGSSTQTTTSTHIESIPEITTIFETESVEILPEFPGGEDALMAYLGKHIKYPETAIRNDVEGRVMLGFIVNTEGDIEDIKILRGIGYECDQEALRVAQHMPKWKPGKNNGKAVKVYFNLPIVFEINR